MTEETNINAGADTGAEASAIALPAGCDGIEMKFNFKTRALRDDNGKEIGRTKKQPSIVTVLPVPSHDTVAGFLMEPSSKESILIMDAIKDVIYTAARNQFDEMIDSFEGDDSRTVSASMLNYELLDISYIANLPPSTRTSSVPAEDDFKAFFADYLAVMVPATGKEEAKIKRHLDHFSKPQRVKAAKDVLNLLVGQLDMYLSATPNIEDHAATAAYIRNKFDKWAKEPEKVVSVDLL